MAAHTIYCDGSCLHAPGTPGHGPAGWGAVIDARGCARVEAAAYIGIATNQVAELTAAIEAIGMVPAGATVDLYTDSEYLVKGISEWLATWKRKNWKTAAGKPVAN